MNVFILCTGRCGSVSFIRACKHITNYSAGHESRHDEIQDARLAYPINHIEADPRLAWFLGRLDAKYGDNAAYVHLIRDELETARSFKNRYGTGIIEAYSNSLVYHGNKKHSTIDLCRDYYNTVNSNIRFFLKNKTKKMEFQLERAEKDFVKFWNFIGATGDLESALNEWNTNYNSNAYFQSQQSLSSRIKRKVKIGLARLMKKDIFN